MPKGEIFSSDDNECQMDDRPEDDFGMEDSSYANDTNRT